MPKDETVVPLAEIEQRILTVREQKVMLDSDLAYLYGVPTKRLNEQVRRNLGRFPPDFMFQLTTEEAGALRPQFATSKSGRGGRRYLPYAFTEHGAIMLASVLNTPRAAEVSVYVVRAFVRLRQLAGMNAAMAEKLAELDRRVMGHDEAIRSLVRTIRQLMTPSDAAPAPSTIAVMGADRAGLRLGGEAKVNVGNNIPEICGRRRIEMRIVGFQGVTRKKVSGTYFTDRTMSIWLIECLTSGSRRQDRAIGTRCAAPHRGDGDSSGWAVR